MNLFSSNKKLVKHGALYKSLVRSGIGAHCCDPTIIIHYTNLNKDINNAHKKIPAIIFMF